MIYRLLIKWFLKKNREIHKLSPEDEVRFFLFRDSGTTLKILQKFLTAQTIQYFEANNEKERQQVKGAAMILKILIDLHRCAGSLQEQFGDNDEKKIKSWLSINNNFVGKRNQPK